nr:chromate transporter [uncultured Blautia sp.]
MTLLRLFYEFAKTGLFAVGGGMATIPFLYAISEKTGWFTATDIGNMIAISESTPGAIGVNMSTYVGFHVSGIIGALIATFGLVLPSIIVIIIISKMLKKFKDSQIVKKVFYGLRPASTGLIIAAGLGVALETFFPGTKISDLSGIFASVQWERILLAAVLFFGIQKWKKHPVFYIVVAAVVGMLFKL